MWLVGRVWVASCPRDARPASLSCSLCLPGLVGSVGRVRSRPRGASCPPPVASFSWALSIRPLPKGMSIGPPGGEFLEVGERRARWGRPTSPDPRPRPKVGVAGAAPPLMPLASRHPWPPTAERTELLCYRFSAISAANLRGAQKPPSVEGGGGVSHAWLSSLAVVEAWLAGGLAVAPSLRAEVPM